MFDIAEQLFPNPITMAVQLCATAVLFIIYRRFLHQPVLKLLNKKSDEFQDEFSKTEALRREQVELRIAIDEEKQRQFDQAEETKLILLSELASIRENEMKKLQHELVAHKERSTQALELERKKMMESLENQVLTLATAMLAKVLEGYSFNEDEMIRSLEQEMIKSNAQL